LLTARLRSLFPYIPGIDTTMERTAAKKRIPEAQA
jgi:hypothetical protein